MAGLKTDQPGASGRRIPLVAIVVVAVILAGVLLVIGYPIVRIRMARGRVATYCERVEVGRPMVLSDVAKAAEHEGFRVIGPMPDLAPGDPRPANPALAPKQKLMVVDGWVFARWICDVNTDKGIVTGKRVSFLD